jgi:hypothetical protein
MKIRSLGVWKAVILGTAVSTKEISNAAAKSNSRDPLDAADHCGFSSSSVDVKSRRGLPGMAHGGKLKLSMIASFNR